MESVASLPGAMGLDSTAQATLPPGAASHRVIDHPADPVSTDQVVKDPDSIGFEVKVSTQYSDHFHCHQLPLFFYS